jgi:hypothetical protein
MSNLEAIDISISLSGTFWKDPPRAKVYINDNLIFENIVAELTEVKWSGNLSEGKHKLTIELIDKDKYQTVIEDNKIAKDQLLNIEFVSFDEIDIGFLKHSLSSYYPDQKQYVNEAPLLVKNCVNLGYNGRWELEFTTPIYIWLLENI